MRPSANDAFTIVELLIVLAILSIVFGFASLALRESPERLAANAFKAAVQEARIESVNRNRPVAVVWDVASGTASVLEADSSAPSCTTNVTTVDAFRLDDFRGVSVATDLGGDGVLWFPSGRGQSCSLSSLASTTTFTSDGNTSQVIMSDGGRVEVQ